MAAAVMIEASQGLRSAGVAERVLPKLDDEEVVALVLSVLRDPRVWSVSECSSLPDPVRKDAVRRAGRMLREALATI
jgi:hypothetical protein